MGDKEEAEEARLLRRLLTLHGEHRGVQYFSVETCRVALAYQSRLSKFADVKPAARGVSHRALITDLVPTC